MTVMVLLDFDVKVGKLEEFLDVLKGILPDTRKYDGCLFLKTCIYEGQNKICLIEEWETKKHQENYFAWRVSTGLPKSIGPFITNVTTTYLDIKQTY